MRIVTYSSYGSADVLRVEGLEKPTAGAGEVLVKVRAATVNPADWHFMTGEPNLLRLRAGALRPRGMRLGIDLAGQVEAIGGGVTDFKPGDAVFGAVRGSWADYVVARAELLVPKPARLSFAQAAAVPLAGLIRGTSSWCARSGLSTSSITRARTLRGAVPTMWSSTASANACLRHRDGHCAEAALM